MSLFKNKVLGKNILIAGIAMAMLLITACGEKQDTEPQALNQSTGDPAIDAVIAEIKKDSTNAALYAKRGSLYYDRKVFGEAIRDYNTALQIDSTKISYYHALADAYLEANESYIALEVLKVASRRFPEDIPTLLKLADFQLIVKQYVEGMATLNKVLAQKPQEANAYYLKGLYYRDMNSPVQALEAFQRSVELNPDLADAYLLMGDMMSDENPELALRFYDNALLSEPENVLALHSKALHLHQHGQLEEALEVYKKVHRLDPRYAESFYNAGLLYLEMDSVQKAESMFSISIANDPMYPKAFFYRGETYRIQGDTSKAKMDYQKALKLNPSFDLPKEQLRAMGEEELIQ